jgi:hypothetical protein
VSEELGVRLQKLAGDLCELAGLNRDSSTKAARRVRAKAAEVFQLGRSVGAEEESTPHRGSETEAWIRRWRDAYPDKNDFAHRAIDSMLDDFRLHADTGTPLRFDAHDPAEQPAKFTITPDELAAAIIDVEEFGTE